jgi:hypothetical protein
MADEVARAGADADGVGNDLSGSRRAVDVEAAPVIVRGALLCYRTIDVADAIDLDAASKVLAADGSKKRTTFLREPPRRDRLALKQAMPTLGVELGACAIELPRIDRTLTGTATAHAYERGAIAVAFRFPVAGGTAMSDLPRVVRQLFDERRLDERAQQEIDAIVDRIAPAVRGRRARAPIDAYTIVLVQALAGGAGPDALRAWSGLPKLVLGETSPAPLHPRQVEETLAGADGYQAGDLCVLGDRCAVVVDPGGELDVPQVIEYVRAQLVELQHLDERVDADLVAAQAALAAPRSRLLQVLWNPHGRAAQAIARRLAETTRFTERLTASTKLLGDAYLTRVARAAFTRFGAGDLQAAIQHKHELVARIHEMLHDEGEAARGLAIELAIVGLIVFEVVFAIVVEH